MNNDNTNGEKVKNRFEKDLEYSQSFKDRLKKFYSGITDNFIYITNKGLQKCGVDVFLITKEGKQILIEEKLQRKKWNTFLFEVQSCSVKDRERKGWMYTSICDFLLYSFELEDGTLESYLIDFKKLKKWFYKNLKKYSIVTTNQINRTKSRVIPIEIIEKEVGFKKYII